jgi:hypothetical protein
MPIGVAPAYRPAHPGSIGISMDPRPSEPAASRPGLRCPVPKWWRRLGAAAFLFFMIKGLLWLAVPALVALGVWGR